MNQPITFRTLLVTNGLIALLILTALLVTGTLASPAPQIAPAGNTDSTTTISYQGHLTNADGTAVNGSLPMTFKLYREPGGGTPVWTEQRSGNNTVPVSDGLFSIALGSVTPIDIGLLDKPLWLGISVNNDAEMTPREQLNGSAVVAGPRLLGEDTCEQSACGAVSESSLTGWHTIKGAAANDPVEITVTASGRPLVAHMTARVHPVSGTRSYCGIGVYQGDTLVKRIHVTGIDQPVHQLSCSGSYVFTDLEPGIYTFKAQAFFSTATEVSWVSERQIAVFEH